MKIIQSNLLKDSKNLLHAFTTQEVGNLAFHIGDNPIDVEKNHQALAKLLNYDKDSLIHMQQIHSNIVYKVESEDNFSTQPKCDALITNKPNKTLMVMVADCTPLLFFDPLKRVIGVAHAGRAGAFSNIVGNLLKSFQEEYGSKPSDIKVVAGAAIHSCCYQVGEEIVAEAKSLHLSYAIIKRQEKFYLDITKILKRQLKEAGILAHHLEFSKECSCCHSKKYYSYRATQNRGRFCALIAL